MIDITKVKRYSVHGRHSKEQLADFPTLEEANNSKFSDTQLDETAKAIVKARQNNKPVIFMMGGHVVKTHQAPYIIDLMKRKIITHIAFPGSFSIHDFEIAYAGKTSEEVADALKDGSFGFAEETGKLLNLAICDGAKDGLGYGEAIGRQIEKLDCKYKEMSMLWNAYKLGIPATGHITLGADIIHQHPECSGEAIGKTSYDVDFKKYFLETASKLEGGVVCNIGCAVTMPEAFLKALSIARNLGYKVDKFTTANFDQKQLGKLLQYRAMVNVLERPTMTGGKWHNIVGLHQQTIPALYKKINMLS